MPANRGLPSRRSQRLSEMQSGPIFHRTSEPIESRVNEDGDKVEMEDVQDGGADMSSSPCIGETLLQSTADSTVTGTMTAAAATTEAEADAEGITHLQADSQLEGTMTIEAAVVATTEVPAEAGDDGFLYGFEEEGYDHDDSDNAPLSSFANHLPKSMITAFTTTITNLSTTLQEKIKAAIAPILRQMEEMNAKMDQMQKTNEEMQGQLEKIREDMKKMQETLVVTQRVTENTYNLAFNRSVGDGSTVAFRLIYGTDGSDPVEDHGYPLIQNTADIRRLTIPQLKDYNRFYRTVLRAAHHCEVTRKVREEGLRLAIGCMVRD